MQLSITMRLLSRRSFLINSALVGGASAAAGLLRPSVWAAPAGANDAIRIAIIGLGTKGRQHLKVLSARDGVRVTALCDLDRAALDSAVKSVDAKKVAPFTTTDPREIMSRRDVDAVIVAAGNHWHALLSVWACQAGKDVYCEKPMTHTVWEGRKMIEAARKYGRIVQAGTQYRSEKGLNDGIKFIHSGQLGKLKHVHAVYYGARGSIGRRAPWYPTNLNYDLFCGPTPMVPLERDKLHYDWHWTWDTGNGELGNNGVHILDAALRIVQSDAPPRRVLGVGGRYVYQDAAETPNSQIAVYDFPNAPVIYEGRALSARPGANYMDAVAGIRVGVVAYCEGGHLTGLTGSVAYDTAGKVIQKFAGDGGGLTHMSNFLSAIRSRNASELAAPVQIGHVSASICHYGNISLRVGRPADASTIAQALEKIPAAATLTAGLQKHLGVHGIDLTKQPLTLGEWLEVDAAQDTVASVGSGDQARLERARYLVHEAQRPPFVIPEQV